MVAAILRRAPPAAWAAAAVIALAALTGPTVAHADVACCCDMAATSQCAAAPATGSCPAGTQLRSYPVARCEDAWRMERQRALEGALKPGWVTTIIGDELIPPGCRVGPQARPQDCDFRSILQVVVNVTRLILGVVGSLALMMFVYGGFLFLLSGGVAQRVDQAKQVLRNATIGIGVIFLSWTIVNLLLTLLTGSQNFGGGANVFNNPWNAGPPASP